MGKGGIRCPDGQKGKVMKLKLVLDDNGNVKIQENENGVKCPVFIDEKGKEFPADVQGMHDKIFDLNKKSKTRREELDNLKQKFSVFDEIEEIEEWYKEATEAIEKVKNFNDKDWLKVDKVDSMKRQMKEGFDADIESVKKSYDTMLKDRDEKIIKKDKQIRKLLVSKSFASSPLFSGENPKTLLSADLAEARFSNQIKVEEDEKTGELHIRCYYSNGDLIISRSGDRIGEPANFDEGLEEIWDNYPGKNRFTPSGTPGGGSKGGSDNLDTKDENDIVKLQKQLNEATEKRDTLTMVALQNKIAKLVNKEKKAS